MPVLLGEGVPVAAGAVEHRLSHRQVLPILGNLPVGIVFNQLDLLRMPRQLTTGGPIILAWQHWLYELRQHGLAGKDDYALMVLATEQLHQCFELLPLRRHFRITTIIFTVVTNRYHNR